MRKIPDAVMLFAAGFGTRMRLLTADRPKPMIQVAGQPLIAHALALAKAVDAEPIVANLHYKPQMLIDYLAPLGVTLVIETPHILDTGGGLRNALPHLGTGPVMTLNTDAVWAGDNPLALLKSEWDPSRMDALLMCVPVDRTVGYSGSGDFQLTATGQLIRGDGLVYGGAQIVKSGLLETIPEDVFSLNVLWDLLARENRLFGMAYSGRWCDVGHPEGIRLAEDLLGGNDV
jgi:MurNAc alpha-1-phosphate uridylyltransferase